MNSEVDIQTCIVANAFDWTFALKESVHMDKEILIKIKLIDNLTTGEENKKVTWRFKLSPGQKVSRSLYLIDLAASVAFDCRVATRDASKTK